MTKRSGLLWSSFTNIFPIHHSDFFNPSLNVSVKDPTVYFLSQVLSGYLTSAEIPGIPSDESGEIDLYFQAEESGGMIAILEYGTPHSDTPDKKNIVLLTGEICVASATEEKISITPHFVLVGKKEHIEGNALLIPHIMIGRVVHQDFGFQPQMLEFDKGEQADITEALCYAEECFRRILAGLGLDSQQAQQWIETDDRTLDSRINYITSRTPNNLAAEVVELQRQTQIASFQTFSMPAPKGLQ